MNLRTENELWAQDEHTTPGGLQTPEYLLGWLYQDAFRIHLPPNTPPGTYFLEVGWFDPTKSEQLDPQADSVTPPLKLLWRSILLPSVEVR